jgi:hypothetical protein
MVRRPQYDLYSPGRILDLYRTVINEAQSAEDLHAYLHEATLKSLRAYMWLPTVVRSAWEHKFPELEQTDDLLLLRRQEAALRRGCSSAHTPASWSI